MEQRKKTRPWVTFFSQTGSEIIEVSKHLNRWPDLIVTNKRPAHLRTINPELEGKVFFVENYPTIEELQPVLDLYENPLITLHGWLRIMPPRICEKYEIYNSHPGLISDYEFLKGKDPQLRAYQAKLPYSGCVIHKVTPGVDEGEILSSARVPIDGLELNDVYKRLHEYSILLWRLFLIDKV